MADLKGYGNLRGTRLLFKKLRTHMETLFLGAKQGSIDRERATLAIRELQKLGVRGFLRDLKDAALKENLSLDPSISVIAFCPLSSSFSQSRNTASRKTREEGISGVADSK
jgi:hypothetical protein